MDHHGEALPILSASAKKMNIDKLLSSPLPTYTTSVPGSFFWTKLAFWMCRRVSHVQFRTTSSSSAVALSRDGAGVMCCGWHTNGLMDPLGIFLQHPKEFVVGARHDLVTRPLLGWWTRKLAVQPVVRKAELLRGGCTEEEANHLNGRSLLALSSGIAHGFGCVLFPEGTSHSESHMLRLKTGPIRTVLAAAALAKANDLPLPRLIPVGLHYRRREWFRTDQYIEFGEPIELESDLVPHELVEAVKTGDWVEPPAETVHLIKERLQSSLPLLTPNCATWSEYRALHLLGHIEARKNGHIISTWQEEVLAARKVRDALAMPQGHHETPAPLQGEAIKAASEAAELLEDYGLDGRDLNRNASGLRRASLLHVPKNLLRCTLFFVLFPFFLTSLGLQVLLGRLLGDDTDEGLDARTSYQFLAAFFGSILIWPAMALVWTSAVWWYQDAIGQFLSLSPGWFVNMTGTMATSWLLFYVLCFPVFFATGKAFAGFWDAWVDLKKTISRRRMKKKDREKLHHILLELQSS